MGKLGLYLHVPFCVRKCHYCDFYSAPTDKGARTAYVRALCRHLIATATGETVDTVYFGGGTPTLLDTAGFQKILETVGAGYTLEKDAEITAECNPVTHAAGLMEGLRRAGVNRLSIGLQSAKDDELRLLGRPHGYAEFLETFSAARRAGFENISVDLMFGIPNQTVKSFHETVDAVIALGPEHISAYGLRIEEGTPFYGMRKSLSLPSEEAEAEMAETVAQMLSAVGYDHYEISNYARPGKRSRHNMRYWLGEAYLGFGPGAHSYYGGERFFTAPDTAAYLAAVEEGDFAGLRQGAEPIVGKELQDEYVMLRMRLFEGVNLADFVHRFGTSFEKAYGDTAYLEGLGILRKTKDRIAFTEKGMRVSNHVLSDWLDFGGSS
ncbi:MAG: radical SAM family heme chaperone HemW [Ruminococcaceae bacterium]|nr:radical SAM family heme chaperone HemW [Oscillospiraceae bacterium]